MPLDIPLLELFRNSKAASLLWKGLGCRASGFKDLGSLRKRLRFKDHLEFP